MRSATSLVCACALALALGACSDSKSDTQAGTTFCFNCHSETTDLGQKILWAQAGYATSVHALGQVERDYTELPATSAAAIGTTAQNTDLCPTFAQANPGTACTAAGFTFVAGTAPAKGTCTAPTGTGLTQNACETAGGVYAGNRWVLSGVDNTGSNAFYANAGGCQACHTEEGFRKRVSGAYDAAGYNSIKFSWSLGAFVGSPTVTPNTPLTADVIDNPSPVGCFTCHTPHGIGTTDNEHLDQTVPVGTAVTTQAGAVYGNSTTGVAKTEGHLCANCHQVEMNNATTNSPIAILLTNLTGASGSYNAASYYGPHHGPQTDMLLGNGGMTYTGTATNGAVSVTFAGTYGNSAHTGLAGADCIACHMQSDYQDINVESTFGVNPSVGGHAFANKGMVHGAEKALILGCGSTTSASQCHTVAGVPTSTGYVVKAANVAMTNGYLQAGDAFFQKFTDATGTVDSGYQLKMNELLTKLANPSTNCTGLLNDAAVLAGTIGSTPGAGVIWTPMADNITIDPRCIDNGAKINKAAAPADDNTNASVRFAKALWNFKFVNKEDKSFGVHNTRYALELLYDSCTDLAVLTGKPAGYCNGTNVTVRP